MCRWDARLDAGNGVGLSQRMLMLGQSPKNQRSLCLRFFSPMNRFMSHEASHAKLSSGDRERDNHFAKDSLWFYLAVVARARVRPREN